MPASRMVGRGQLKPEGLQREIEPMVDLSALQSMQQRSARERADDAVNQAAW